MNSRTAPTDKAPHPAAAQSYASVLSMTSQSDSTGTAMTVERSATPSVASVQWTANESWADDDSCWLQAISETDLAKRSPKPAADKGWKTVPSAQQSAQTASGSGKPAPAASGWRAGAPQQAGGLGSRFEALAPSSRRGRH